MSSKPTKLLWSVPPPSDDWFLYESWGWRYQTERDWNDRCECWEHEGHWRYVNWTQTAKEWGSECRQYHKDVAGYKKKISELEQEITELKKRLGTFDNSAKASNEDGQK